MSNAQTAHGATRKEINTKSYFYFRTGDYPITHDHKIFPPSEGKDAFWEFIYITSGEYTHKINGKTRILSENMLCVIRPDDKHSTHQNKPDSTYITLCVKQEYFAVFMSLLGDGLIDGLLSFEFIEINTSSIKAKYIKSILDEYFASTKNDYSDMSTCNLFLLAFTNETISFLSKDEKKFLYSPGVETFISLLSKSENLSRQLSDLIDATNYSYSHFNSIFKKEVGVTPSDYLKEKRLNYAKRLLVSTTYKHESIAEIVGFATHSRFCVFFKEKTGLTPSQYAAKYRISSF